MRTVGVMDRWLGTREKRIVNYPAGLSPVGVVVLGDSFVADAEIPGRVALVRHGVVVNAVVGQRLDFRQITARKEEKINISFFSHREWQRQPDSLRQQSKARRGKAEYNLLDDHLAATVSHKSSVDLNHSILAALCAIRRRRKRKRIFYYKTVLTKLRNKINEMK